jgi:uncharacterized LabA/DUF88 family protein
MTHNSQRVGIFVDVQNMFYSAKTIHCGKIEYGKFLEELVQGRQLVRAIAYIVQKADVNQSAFKEALQRFGYELRVKELKIREGSDGKMKARGNWNVGIAVEVLEIASRLDTVVLCSGDNEMTPLVESLKSKGVRVELCSFPGATGHKLKNAVDRFMAIPDECIFKEKKFDSKKAEEHGLGSTDKDGIDRSGLPEDDYDEEYDEEYDESPLSLDIH